MATLDQFAAAAPGLASGSVPWEARGLHVHAAVRPQNGALVAVRIARAPAPRVDAQARPVLERVARHLATGREDLSDVKVDLSEVAPFHRRVLETLLARVGPGEAVGYGELARLCGSPGASRAVGGAMARNPVPVVVPCHRVLPAGGRVGNYSGEGGWETKMALLRLEGAPLPRQA